jgi:hypothetical protein
VQTVKRGIGIIIMSPIEIYSHRCHELRAPQEHVQEGALLHSTAPVGDSLLLLLLLSSLLLLLLSSPLLLLLVGLADAHSQQHDEEDDCRHDAAHDEPHAHVLQQQQQCRQTSAYERCQETNSSLHIMRRPPLAACACSAAETAAAMQAASAYEHCRHHVIMGRPLFKHRHLTKPQTPEQGTFHHMKRRAHAAFC